MSPIREPGHCPSAGVQALVKALLLITVLPSKALVKKFITKSNHRHRSKALASRKGGVETRIYLTRTVPGGTAIHDPASPGRRRSGVGRAIGPPRPAYHAHDHAAYVAGRNTQRRMATRFELKSRNCRTRGTPRSTRVVDSWYRRQDGCGTVHRDYTSSKRYACTRIAAHAARTPTTLAARAGTRR